MKSNTDCTTPTVVGSHVRSSQTSGYITVRLIPTMARPEHGSTDE